MVLTGGNRLVVAADEVVNRKRSSGGGHRLEADRRRTVWRAIRHQVVLGLECASRHRRVGEEQPVQVQDQACVQRTPVLLEQVVLGVTVAGQFLFAPVTTTPSIAEDAVMLSTRARSASPVSSPGIWSR